MPPRVPVLPPLHRACRTAYNRPAMAVILHIDMDAFFAAVEELDHPEWRGRPVIVGADPKGGKGRGVVSTASYAARAFGVHSAMPIGEAWRRCPDAVFVRPRMERYAALSREIMTVFRAFTPLVEPLSLDEAFLDVTGSLRLFGLSAEALARRIKETVRARTKLTCSVGLSALKSVAKIASDLKKPDGLVIVPEGQERIFLAPLPVRRLWGVGPRTAEKLEAAGITRIGEVQRCSRSELIRLLGRAAAMHVHALACARDPRPVRALPDPPLTVSHEHTFPEDVDVTDEERISRTLLDLADRTAARLRRHGFRARTVTLKYRTGDFRTYTRRRRSSPPVDDTNSLYRTAAVLAQELRRRGGTIRLLGVGAADLEQAGESRQGLLFEPGERARLRALEEAVDRVRARFGRHALFRGNLLDEGMSCRDEDP